MGLASSENPENLGNSVVAKVPVPIFHSLGAKTGKTGRPKIWDRGTRCPAKVGRRSRRRIGKTSCVPVSTLDPPRFEPPSAFRPSPLTRLPVLPSSMHKPWAGSESHKTSGLNTVYGWTASPVHSSSLPSCVRFNAAVARLAATLDTTPVASSYPRALFHPLVNKPLPVRTCNRWFRVATIQAGGVPKPFPLDEWPQSGADSSPVQRPWLGLSGLAA
jgi:hypothetical protein